MLWISSAVVIDPESHHVNTLTGSTWNCNKRFGLHHNLIFMHCNKSFEGCKASSEYLQVVRLKATTIQYTMEHNTYNKNVIYNT